MRLFLLCILSTAFAGALVGCNRREPAVAVAEAGEGKPPEKLGDKEAETMVFESTSIEEVDITDAEAKLTVRLNIPAIGESDEVFFLKKVVTRTTFKRNADGSYSGSGSGGGGAHCFRACGEKGSFGGSNSISSSSPDRIKVSIHRSWNLASGAIGQTDGEIEVPWMGQSQKAFGDGTKLDAIFVAVEKSK